MKEALYYNKLGDKKVNCVLCPRNCTVEDGKRGFCGVRENQDGKLVSLVYSRPISVAVDPIEKKPLFHFLPGSDVLSFGTVGCNLRCKHCQNWEISQANVKDMAAKEISPEQIVDLAIRDKCESIAYTYTEPTVFYEYVLETAKLAKKKGIKNVIVSNGFINQEPLKEWIKYIDGANIDLKGDDKFYKTVTTAWLDPVLESIKTLKENKVWLELTNLIIPTLNDSEKKITEMCKWIKDNVGVNVPMHFSRFFPYYKLNDLPPTPVEILKKAYDIAVGIGLNYVYVGNIDIPGKENTYCPKCKKPVIKRWQYSIEANNLTKGKCSCGKKVAGVWE